MGCQLRRFHHNTKGMESPDAIVIIGGYLEPSPFSFTVSIGPSLSLKPILNLLESGFLCLISTIYHHPRLDPPIHLALLYAHLRQDSSSKTSHHFHLHRRRDNLDRVRRSNRIPVHTRRILLVWVGRPARGSLRQSECHGVGRRGGGNYFRYVDHSCAAALCSAPAAKLEEKNPSVYHVYSRDLVSPFPRYTPQLKCEYMLTYYPLGNSVVAVSLVRLKTINEFTLTKNPTCKALDLNGLPFPVFVAFLDTPVENNEC